MIYTYSYEMCNHIKDSLDTLDGRSDNIYIVSNSLSDEELNTLLQQIRYSVSCTVIATNYVDFGLSIPWIEVLIDTCLVYKTYNPSTIIYQDRTTLSFREHKYPKMEFMYRLISNVTYESSILEYETVHMHDANLLLRMNQYTNVQSFVSYDDYEYKDMVHYILQNPSIVPLTYHSRLLPLQNILFAKIIQNMNEPIECILIKVIALIIINRFQREKHDYLKDKFMYSVKTKRRLLSHFYEMDELSMLINIFMTYQFNMNTQFINDHFFLNDTFFQKIGQHVDYLWTYYINYRGRYPFSWEHILEKYASQHSYVYLKYYKIYSISFSMKQMLSKFLFSNLYYPVFLTKYQYISPYQKTIRFYTTTDPTVKQLPFLHLHYNKHKKACCRLFILLYDTNIYFTFDLHKHIHSFYFRQLLKKTWKMTFKNSLNIITSMVSYRPHNPKMIELMGEWYSMLQDWNEQYCDRPSSVRFSIEGEDEEVCKG